VIYKHALRAAVVPVITIFGIDFATLLAGAVITEQIFGIQGIGYQALSSIRTLPDLASSTRFVRRHHLRQSGSEANVAKNEAATASR
jgi:peptide/nickel transport system permease protein